VNKPAACRLPKKAADNLKSIFTRTARVVVVFIAVVYHVPPATHTVPPSSCLPAGSPPVPTSPHALWVPQMHFSLACGALSGSFRAPGCLSPYSPPTSRHLQQPRVAS